MSKKIDIVVLIILPIVAAFLAIALQTNFLIFILLFFGLPAAYLTARNPGTFKKSLIFAILFAIPLSLVIDTLGALDGGWIIPKSIFPFRIFGVATIENGFFSLFWVLFVILFWEYFFNGGKRGDVISKNVKYFIYLAGTLIIVVSCLFFINKNLLVIPYFYLIAGIVFVTIPLLIFLYYYPTSLKRFSLISLYFFFVLFLAEIVALKTGQWIFPGQHFIGFISIYDVRFPVEELLFWIILATPSLLSWYGFFFD